jgi:pimeloyl-ACP methyl ester carboxylesterase
MASSAFTKVRRVAGPLALPVVTPIEIAHDTMTRGVYGLTGRALEAGATAAGLVVSKLPEQVLEEPAIPGAPSRPAPEHIADHRRARAILAILHGFHGDKLAAAGSAVSYPMTLRRSGRDVPVTKAGLTAAYPDAKSTVVVFVHGFVGNEQIWKRRSDRDDHGRALSYGRRLEADGDVSALWVRYNSGLRVSTNGRQLRDLMRKVKARWPVPVERIIFVGHSMGGLVAHSALAQSDLDEPWTEVTTDTVTLGTPHHGTPLERTANTIATVSAGHHATRWVSEIIRTRSDGIRDMRHGNLVDDDWRGHDPEDPEDRRTHARPHEQVRHLAVVATVSRDPHSRWADYCGDLVVPRDSARGWAHAEDGAVGSSRTVHLGGLNHLDLQNHPRVHSLIADIVGVDSPDSETPRDYPLRGR